MNFEDVLSEFKKNKTVAEYLDVTKGTVSKWRKQNLLPEKRARQLAMEMPDKFSFDAELYKRKAS
ncbi:hypothetical protein [Cysteiniphilum halobium]|uniref:hypothetical protein n=1 Tax=Cysteiniphilum halobium TaxID=2219059 RepID=UPI003F830CDB